MKKPRISNKLNFELLDGLAEDENSCIQKHKLKHHVALHPYHLNDLKNSVEDILNNGIAKYSERLDGILFGFKNIEFLSHTGTIWDDFCFIHIDIEADFFVFKPELGKLLQGVVNKKSKDHIGCLIHKMFNVSILTPEDSDDWLGNTATLGSEILCKITYTDFDGRLPYMRGEIVSILSQPDVPIVAEPAEQKKSKKKKSSKKLDFSDPVESVLESGTVVHTTKKSKKSKIKNEIPMDDLDSTFRSVNNECNSTETVENKGKKKLKKENLSFEFSLGNGGLVEGENSDSPSGKKKSKKSKDSSKNIKVEVEDNSFAEIANFLDADQSDEKLVNNDNEGKASRKRKHSSSVSTTKLNSSEDINLDDFLNTFSFEMNEEKESKKRKKVKEDDETERPRKKKKVAQSE